MPVEIPLRKIPHYWNVYLLAATPLLLIVLFNYYPIYNGIVHIFYRWDGDQLEEFIGFGNIVRLLHDRTLLHSFGVVLLFVAANLIKMIPAIFAAVILHHLLNRQWQYLYRICFILPMIVPSVVKILLWKYFYEPNSGLFNAVLRGLGAIGPEESVAFLSDPKLLLPSLIFQDFPWVGAFGVLIYLAGLQNISREIYESARLDGAGPWRIFYHIELPLITTQIRINFALMIISTIRGWENVYLFVGEGGGPESVAAVPGLLIFREAFSRGYFGYGCAIGFVIFIVTLLATALNNKFVRVKR